MTESEWNSCTDPQPMLEFLRGKASDRKLRLFAVACCRRIFFLLKDERVRQGVVAAENVADGKADMAELDSFLVTLQEDADHLGALTVVIPIWASLGTGFFHVGLFNLASAVAWNAVLGAVKIEDDWDMPADPAWREVYLGEKRRQAALLREIMANSLFRLVADPFFLTPNVLALAQATYDERAFDRMPILADALEEAGCTDSSILEHCRSGGEHVRGCWVLDLLLGKE